MQAVVLVEVCIGVFVCMQAVNAKHPLFTYQLAQSLESMPTLTLLLSSDPQNPNHCGGNIDTVVAVNRDFLDFSIEIAKTMTNQEADRPPTPRRSYRRCFGHADIYRDGWHGKIWSRLS